MSNHHTIPKFYLKNFCNEAGQVYFYDKKSASNSKKISARNPRSIFQRKHHNSFLHDDGSYDESLESGFSKHDTIASIFYKKIISQLENDEVPVFDAHTRNQFDRYNIFLFMRQPEIIDPIIGSNPVSIFTSSIESYEEKTGQKLSPEEISDAKYHLKADQLHAVQVQRGQVREGPLRALAAKRLMFCRIENPKKSFIIGSQLFVRFGGDRDLRTAETCLFAPMSSKLAFVYVPPNETREIYDIVDPQDVRRLNIAIAKQSRMFAASSEALVRSIASHLDLPL